MLLRKEIKKQMYHKIILVGHVGRNPDMKYLEDGRAVTNLSLAVSDYKNNQKETIWFNVSVFGKQAENVAQYVQKGSSVYVEGSLRHKNGKPRLYKNQDGVVTPANFEVVADTVRFLSSAKRGEGEAAVADSEVEESVPSDAEIEDIPF